MASLGCDHFYCRECYTQFWTVKVSEGNDPELLRCICHKCPYVANHLLVQEFLAPEIYEQYLNLLCNKIVLNNNKKLKGCPTPDCEAVVKVCFGNISYFWIDTYYILIHLFVLRKKLHFLQMQRPLMRRLCQRGKCIN